MANKNKSQIGSYAFILGVLLAVLLGFLQAPVWAIAIMAVLGLVVAGLNIRHEDVRSYLLYNVALMVGVGALSNMLSVLTAPLGLGRWRSCFNPSWATWCSSWRPEPS